MENQINITVSQYLGTLMHSSLEIWKQHLLTSDYNVHVILNDFYDEIVDKVDSFIEVWMSYMGKPDGFENILVVEENDYLKYLVELRAIISANRTTYDKVSELGSLTDEILTLIDSTIYKIKELTNVISSSVEESYIPSFDNFNFK